MTIPAGYCMDSNPQPVDLAAQSHVDSLVQVLSARQSHDWNIISVLLVDEFAADPCLQHLNIYELFRRNNEDVAKTPVVTSTDCASERSRPPSLERTPRPIPFSRLNLVNWLMWTAGCLRHLVHGG